MPRKMKKPDRGEQQKSEARVIFGVTNCKYNPDIKLIKASDPELAHIWGVSDFNYCPLLECGHVAYYRDPEAEYVMKSSLSEVSSQLAGSIVQLAIEQTVLRKKIAELHQSLLGQGRSIKKASR